MTLIVVPFKSDISEAKVVETGKSEVKMGVCQAVGCDTILSKYNNELFCGSHAQPDFNVSAHLPIRVTTEDKRCGDRRAIA